jgi:hypothetical protein
MRDFSDWQSFWDLASPEHGASKMLEIYGASSAEMAAGCASAALADDRDEDYRFWTAVQARLQAASQHAFRNERPASGVKTVG